MLCTGRLVAGSAGGGSYDQGQWIGSMMENMKKLAPRSIKGGAEGDRCQVSPRSDEDEESL